MIDFQGDRDMLFDNSVNVALRKIRRDEAQRRLADSFRVEMETIPSAAG
jgi:hypothetical protein